MNIKEHIDAGHYPKDEKGRALVPVRDGRTVTILATDLSHPHYPIVGILPVNGYTDHDVPRAWAVDGAFGAGGGEPKHSCDLLPPAPRKVTVRCKLRHNGHDFVVWDLEGMPMPAWREGAVIEFTTEYEEPWS